MNVLCDELKDYPGTLDGFLKTKNMSLKEAMDIAMKRSKSRKKRNSWMGRNDFKKPSNSTGFVYVTRINAPTTRQGFTWCYSYERHDEYYKVSSVSLRKLCRMVKEDGFPWIVFDEELAESSYLEDELNNHNHIYKK